jgi:hypothetical protein
VEFDMDRKNKVYIICLQKLNIAKRILILISLLTLFLLGINIQGTESSNIRKEIVLKSKVGSNDSELGFMTLKNGETIVPSAITIDSNGNIYIADIANDRIQKYDKDGKFLFKINMHIKRKKWYKIIDDLSVDNANNLYVASRHEGKIDKYSPEGKLLQSINLDDKNIYWDEKKGWGSGAVQIERIMVDITGNIYLHGVYELIKFDSKGNILKKWAPILFVRSSVLDEAGNLYLAHQKKVVEKYDMNSKLLATEKCGKLYSWLEEGYCFVPQFIDKNGFIYWFEKKGTVAIKADKLGKRHGDYRIRNADVYGNTVKFDSNGNLYIFNYSGDEFWVEKIIFQ